MRWIMKLNFIDNAHIAGDENVLKLEETKVLYAQPDKPKEQVGMFNYWDECKRSNISDDAKLLKLCIDYDDGARRADVESAFKDYDYIIYNSTGNKCSEGIEKFRLILTLKDPIIASDLEHWRTTNKFKVLFHGCDFSSFAKGRFFYRPSKYDKDHAEVIIKHNEGRPFDFYSIFPHWVKNEEFDRLVSKLKFGRIQTLKTSDRYVSKFIEKIGEGGLHYPDIPSFILKAKFYEVEYSTAKDIFSSRYEGDSKWEKNFENCWMTFNPNKTISQR